MEQDNWRKCDICNGHYPIDKHNFVLCRSLDIEWDLKQIRGRRNGSKTAIGGYNEEHFMAQFINKNTFAFSKSFGYDICNAVVLSGNHKTDIRWACNIQHKKQKRDSLDNCVDTGWIL